MTPVELVLSKVKLPFKLRQYQIDDVNNLVYCENSGLFNDLGLGKTVTSFLIACYKIITEQFKACYVICPAQLVTQWYLFMKDTGVDVVAYKGTPKKREEINLNQDFIIMSYQIFVQEYDKLKRDDYFFIFDEATVFCNTRNITYKVFNGGRTEKKITIPGKLKPETKTTIYPRINKGCCLLTGTPINNLIDAYGLVEVKTPGVYRNFEQFKRIHVEEEEFKIPTKYCNVDLLKENLMLHAVRRLVTDHLELPPIIYNTVFYDLSDEHYRLYEKLIEDKMIVHKGQVTVDALTAQGLYQASQKIIISPEVGGIGEYPAVFELMDLCIESVEQFIIFSTYVNSNKKFMKKYDIGGVFGSAPNATKAIEKFLKKELRGLTMHYLSGGIGLNLQNCHNILVPELPVTPRMLRQAVARCYRSGQQNTVVVTVFVAKGTIQETLFNRLKEKDYLSQTVIRENDYLDDILTEDMRQAISVSDLIKELYGKALQ